MAERELKKRSTKDQEVAAVPDETVAGSGRGEKLKAEMDDLLDEIDEVLENNAEEFVRNYVQKGGE
jgi:ubiquitin-like protein Pup